MKYYVSVKPLKFTLEAPTPREAVKKVLIQNEGRGILVGPYAEVSVSGFYQDWLFSSDEILSEIYDENILAGVYNITEEKYVLPSSVMEL